jgi:molybdopterin/thiamine biosynthesis adenylyltransferase
MSHSGDRLERYARHIMLKEIGGLGQRKLENASAAIVGLGALGGPTALYLAAAGVGRLRLIDPDTVALSNLQRQILFRSEDVGALKTTVAASTLERLNPDCRIETITEALTEATAADLFSGMTLAIDGTDSFAARFAGNRACLHLAIPFITGAIGRWSAQAGVYRAGPTRTLAPELRSPCYQCFVHEAPQTDETCAAVGVIGPLAGVVGSRLALEAIKEIVGAGRSLDGRLWLFDALSGEERTIGLPRNPACPTCGPEAGLS